MNPLQKHVGCPPSSNGSRIPPSNIDSLERLVSKVSHALQDTVATCVPTKLVNEYSKAWWSDIVWGFHKNMNIAHNRWQRTHHRQDRNIYLGARCLFTQEIKHAKARLWHDFWQKLLSMTYGTNSNASLGRIPIKTFKVSGSMMSKLSPRATLRPSPSATLFPHPIGCAFSPARLRRSAQQTSQFQRLLERTRFCSFRNSFGTLLYSASYPQHFSAWRSVKF